MTDFYKPKKKIETYRPRKDIEKKQFTSDRKWRTLRMIFLRQHPLCGQTAEGANPIEKGCGGAASNVHHIQSRETHPELRFDVLNLQSACQSCHSTWTATEMGKGQGG